MKMHDFAPERLSELEDRAAFPARHIGTTPEEQAQILATLGFASRAALMDALVPAAIRERAPLELPAPVPEAEALAKLSSIAAQNKVMKSYIGQGYYGTHTPGVILRNILENPAWYTAYTPYQPEIAQGRLEALINFQTMVCDLTGMAIANASMLDEATAAAEAMTLALRVGKSASRRFFVADDVFAQTQDVIRTRARPLGIEVVTGPAAEAGNVDAYAALVQYPGATGEVRDFQPIGAAVHARGGLLIAAADILALTLLAPPGEWGADVVVGSTQRFGVPMGYGGPHAGYLATRDEFKRSMPGRLVGVTTDADGNAAYRLALQTREQHIRREKATSNICTAQVLLAVIAGMYAVYHGPEGLTRIARRVRRLTAILKAGLERLGFAVPTGVYFDTIAVATGEQTRRILDCAVAHGANFHRIDARTIGLSLDETTTREDVARLWHIFNFDDAPFTVADYDAALTDALPQALVRTSSFLAHPVFHRHHSETEMLRYLRRLADHDLALDRSMIPLGSCTMKLNATSEMIPVTWPAFGALHPFAPLDQAAGYHRMIGELERMLCAVTGYDAVSLQPNAGSQGEYAGLLMIAAWHASRGEPQRNVCLIPASAHGTNPASAQMAGMKVVVVACDADGNVDLADLEAKARAHAADLSAVMVTYPSTHGVFESGIGRLCEIVHAHGGQVYVDGANLNALVGLAAPGHFGADVSHLNLHKTFCIPHGGGGPGVGPVAVKAHLAPFLPGHRHLVPDQAEGQASSPGGHVDGSALPSAIGPVAAAPYGSASILPISWMYVTMMGGEGLRAATESAIVAANYIAHRLAPHYPVLYAGPGGLVAHECILDLRPLKAASGIEAEDVAKRLMDYGFHAPTMSFPVPGTLMVEPTESEGKAELDRFIDAMIAIRMEIRAVEEGRMDRADNPLKHAPHTAAAVSADTWTHAYPRTAAAYPASTARAGKYWPPVARVDNVYGDRNLFCSCIPVAGDGAADPPAVRGLMRILVLGAGVVGVTAAWYLAQDGHEVTVLDRHPGAALETSFANGGQISASYAEPWANPEAPWKILKWLGRDDAPLLFRLRADPRQWRWGLQFLFECLPSRTRHNTIQCLNLALYSRDCLKALRAETGIAYDHLERGILSFYTDPGEFAQGVASAALMREFGCDRDVKTVDECVAIEPALVSCRDRLAGGIFTASDESGDAQRFTQELARMAEARGARFRWGMAIESLAADGQAVTGVRCINEEHRKEVLSADRYVVALGSYSPFLLKPLDVPCLIYPAKGYSATIAIGGHAGAPTVSLTDLAWKIVFTRLSGRLRVAGTAELSGYNKDLNLVRCDALVKRTFDLFPDAGDRGSAQFWTGLRPATPSNVPLVGGTRYPNLFLDTGHGTLGWTMACGSGRALADVIAGRKPGVEFAFTDGRISPDVPQN